MRFNKHLSLEGKHAFLSPSTYHWLRYSDEKMVEVWKKAQAKERGTRLHALAAECILMGVKLPDKQETLAMYVNDGINYKMIPEQPLYFSDFCYGTADTISFRKGELRIHDLKTGVTPASMEQLEIYAALFCMEYQQKPADIMIELRIYQNNEVIVFNPTVADIVPIMDRIAYFDKLLRAVEEEPY